MPDTPSSSATTTHERLAAALAERYRIERRPDGSLALLGRGGTATVYLAHDLRHDRRVALKVVHEDLAASVGAERFLREIHFIARLSHPHILPLFDSGEAGGLLYYVMPYVTDESLRQQLVREGRLPVATAIRITCQIALALDYAHRNGVIHRDIKPENILFQDDQAVVADFGIATAMEESAGPDRLTGTGLAIGTPPYMSPEQAGGGSEIDGRSDVYSLGCVFYEMLAGEPPFVGPTPQSVMAQQVVAPLLPIRSRRSDVPEPVEGALAKALAKEPGDRFASAAEFATALEGAGSADRRESRPVRGRTALLVGLGAVAATALLFALGVSDRREQPPETPRIVVLPFQNLGAPEDGYFSDGITEEITSRLVTIPGLGVISGTSAKQYRESKKSVKEIGRELGVDYILEGGVRWQRVGGSSRVRVTPQLIRVSDDRHLWAGRYDETIEEVFEVQSRIAEQVATALDMALQEPDHEALAAKPTEDLRAYDFYLRGNDHFDRPTPEANRAAEEMYTRATELDPAFALAFARLARIYISQFHFSERTPARLALARRAADSALRLQPNLAEAHLALGQIHYWGELDYEAALQEFRIAHAADPGNGDLAWARGLVERRLGQWDQAIADLRRALELDPRSAVKSLDLFEVHFRRREYAEAERYLTRALELEPHSPVYIYRALLLVTRDGDLAGALEAIKEGINRAGVEDMAVWTPQAELGAALWSKLDSTTRAAVDQVGIEEFGPDSAAYYLGKAKARRYRGDTRAATAYFDSATVVLEGRSRARPDDPELRAKLALAYAGLGRREPAIREGRRAVELRPPSKDTWLGVDMVRNLAVVYATLGEADSAVQQLRLLLTVPSWISVPGLGSDPTWDPIRRDPAFQALLRRQG